MATLSTSLLCALGMFAVGQQVGPRPVVVLGPADRTPPAARVIEAEANYLYAAGEFAKDAAEARLMNAAARKINAEAVAQEIENSLRYVEAYFERRRVNEQYRAEHRPNYLKQQERIRETKEKRLRTQFEDVLKQDVTAMLNWLLVELSGPTLAFQSFPDPMLVKFLDQPLDPGDVSLIRLSDGGRSGGRTSFRADKPAVLETNWPWALRGPEFDDLRADFESARDLAIADLRADGRVSHERGTALFQTSDALLVAIEEKYPKAVRRPTAVCLEYFSARNYVRSLLIGVRRTVESNDRGAFDGSLQFQGKGLIDLLQHLYRNGLVFAPPEPGGERVYRALLTSMRNMYVAVVADDEFAVGG